MNNKIQFSLLKKIFCNIKKLNNISFIFLTCLTIFLFFAFIYKYTYTILFWDEWSIVDQVLNKNIDLNFLRYQHNEHRIGFGLILIRLIVKLSYWNSYLLTFFIGLLILTSFIFCLHIKSKYHKSISLYDISLALIFFNLNQWGNINWGFQISFVLPLFFLFLSLFLILNRKPLTDYILIIISIFSSYSSFHGLLIPVIIIFYYVFQLYIDQKKILQKAFFILSHLLIILTYFVGYVRSDLHFRISNIPLYLKYSVLLINNFIGYRHLDLISLMIFTLIMLPSFCFIIFFIKKKKIYYYPLIALFIYSYLFIFVATIGRSSFGVSQAFSSRYNTMMIPIFSALYLSLWIIKFKNYLIKDFSEIIFIILIFISFYRGFTLSRYELYIYAFKKGTDAWRSCFIKYEDIDKCDKLTAFKIYPDAQAIGLKNKIELLKKYKMNIYSQ